MAAQPSSAQRGEFAVLDIELGAHLFQALVQFRIVDVADAWEQVVLHLEVQSAEEPVPYLVVRGEVDGGVRLKPS